jgi:hypothetical protein
MLLDKGVAWLNDVVVDIIYWFVSCAITIIIVTAASTPAHTN